MNPKLKKAYREIFSIAAETILDQIEYGEEEDAEEIQKYIDLIKNSINWVD